MPSTAQSPLASAWRTCYGRSAESNNQPKKEPTTMSTRATIHFMRPGAEKPTAIIYRHGDGYPEGLGKDLKKFVAEVKKQCADSMGGMRFNDASYLAAKWVVWDAAQMAKYSVEKKGDPIQPLNFISVGIVDQDPGDIEYRYTVVCDGKPTISHEAV